VVCVCGCVCVCGVCVCVCGCVVQRTCAQMRNDRPAICLRRTARKSEGEMCLSTLLQQCCQIGGPAYRRSFVCMRRATCAVQGSIPAQSAEAPLVSVCQCGVLQTQHTTAHHTACTCSGYAIGSARVSKQKSNVNLPRPKKLSKHHPPWAPPSCG
jgi:hypothetical protein